MAERMEPIRVAHYDRWGKGVVMADVLETGEVKIWTNYDIAPHEPTILITPEEWDRLAAWVEWQ